MATAVAGIYDQVKQAVAEYVPVATVTVVRGANIGAKVMVLPDRVEGSAPRPVGATMAVSSGGELAGSVSGGCVEGAVFEEAQEVLKSGEPKLLRFGITDEMAWDVGLACGGTIEVFVEPLDGVESRQSSVVGRQ